VLDLQFTNRFRGEEMKKLKKLFEEEIFIQRRITAEIAAQFPVGAIIEFEKGGHMKEVEILSHGYRTDLRVINVHTRKEQTIEISSHIFDEKKLRRIYSEADIEAAEREAREAADVFIKDMATDLK